MFTVNEVASILRRLDGQMALSPRVIRYWDREGGIQPSKVEGGARLYGLSDLALLRLIGRLQAAVGPFQIRAALAYGAADLRAAIESRRATILAVRNVVACVTTPSTVARDCPNAVHQERLDRLWDGLEDAAARWRTEHEKLWAGWWMKPAEALRRAVRA